MTEPATVTNVKTTDNIVPFQSENKDNYLTLKSVEEDYNISILTVQEIVGMLPIIQVPQTLLFLKDVINLHD